MSSWSSPSSCTLNQAGSRYRKKKTKKQLVLDESVLLQEILLQDDVGLVIVWVGDCVKAQLDDLLAEGGDGVVESVPLLHDIKL
jgi:hypothetical protein